MLVNFTDCMVKKTKFMEGGVAYGDVQRREVDLNGRNVDVLLDVKIYSPTSR
jgi:hypothetical protein